MKKYFDELLENGVTNFVFIGEAGSGKTENAVNTAIYLSENTDKVVHFFDMDQSKPIYRSRDIFGKRLEDKIVFHQGQDFLSAPFVPSGVIETLKNDYVIGVFDIGGNSIGAINMGQYAEYLNAQNTLSYYVINSYRIFSNSIMNVRKTIDDILTSSRIKDIRLISNPNIGDDTTAEDVISGHKKTVEMVNLLDKQVDFMSISNHVKLDEKDKLSNNILNLDLYVKY